MNPLETGTSPESCLRVLLCDAIDVIKRIWAELAPHIHCTPIKSVLPVAIPRIPWVAFEVDMDHQKLGEEETLFHAIPLELGSEHVRRLANMDMCDTAARLFLPLIHDALSDYINPELTVFRDSFIIPKVQYFSPYTPDQVWHTVITVVLNGGEEYIIDLTGIQFGHEQIVSSWEDYQNVLQCADAYRDREICDTNTAPALIQEVFEFARDVISKDYFYWKDMVLKAGGSLEDELDELIHALKQRAKLDIEDWLYRRRYERKKQGLN